MTFHNTIPPIFYADKDSSGKPAVFRRGIYMTNEEAKRLHAVFSNTAANRTDWFQEDAAVLASQLDKAIKEVEAARERHV